MDITIRKSVLAWDPDFTKLTSKEKKELDDAISDMKKNGTVSHNDINWE